MDTSANGSLASRVREARAKLSLSARGLSARAGVAQAHVGMIERGAVTNPRSETLRKIAAALGVSMHWLLQGVDDPAPLAPTGTDGGR